MSDTTAGVQHWSRYSQTIKNICRQVTCLYYLRPESLVSSREESLTSGDSRAARSARAAPGTAHALPHRHAPTTIKLEAGRRAMLLVHLSVVVFVTVFLHVIPSHLFHSWATVTKGTPWSHLKRHFKTNALGNLLYSSVVGSLAAYSVLAHWNDMKVLHDSWIPYISAEILLCFLLIDLSTTYPRSMLKDKASIAHHVTGVLCLVVPLWWRGITMELTVIRLLSQLSIPVLILRLFLLDLGMSDTLLYLATFSSMIVVFFLSRIATIPWYWKRAVVFIMETPDMTPVLLVLLSLVIDLLNFYWFVLMLKTYRKYYPDRYNLFRFLWTTLKLYFESILHVVLLLVVWKNYFKLTTGWRFYKTVI